MLKLIRVIIFTSILLIPAACKKQTDVDLMTYVQPTSIGYVYADFTNFNLIEALESLGYDKNKLLELDFIKKGIDTGLIDSKTLAINATSALLSLQFDNEAGQTRESQWPNVSLVANTRNSKDIVSKIKENKATFVAEKNERFSNFFAAKKPHAPDLYLAQEGGLLIASNSHKTISTIKPTTEKAGFFSDSEFTSVNSVVRTPKPVFSGYFDLKTLLAKLPDTFSFKSRLTDQIKELLPVAFGFQTGLVQNSPQILAIKFEPTSTLLAALSNGELTSLKNSVFSFNFKLPDIAKITDVFASAGEQELLQQLQIFDGLKGGSINILAAEGTDRIPNGVIIIDAESSEKAQGFFELLAGMAESMLGSGIKRGTMAGGQSISYSNVIGPSVSLIQKDARLIATTSEELLNKVVSNKILNTPVNGLLSYHVDYPRIFNIISSFTGEIELFAPDASDKLKAFERLKKMGTHGGTLLKQEDMLVAKNNR